MKSMPIPHFLLPIGCALSIGTAALAAEPAENPQPGPEPPPFSRLGPPPGFDGPPPFGPGGFGGFGGQMRQETKIVSKFDTNGDKRLDAAERKAARDYLQTNRSNGGPGGFRFRGGPPGFRGPGRTVEPAKPGESVSPADVKLYPDAPLYDLDTLRTIFLEFAGQDWEEELEAFHGTDVDVPARVTADGKVYPDVGVHFRGMSSYGMVPEGRKRSLNLSFDFARKGQAIQGYRTLNLLNSHEDPSFLRTVLYSRIAREYIPAPKANFVRVVINGEDWGVYTSAQQFNKDFTQEAFGTTGGARWKVPGSPGGRGSLAFLGENPGPYKGIYEIKSKNDTKSWEHLIRLCKVLNQTPASELQATLEPLLDVDGVLRFLALENALINNDGYWVRTSDYDLYEDPKGRFHVIPSDFNETFARPGGPGFGGPPGMRGMRGFRGGMGGGVAGPELQDVPAGGGLGGAPAPSGVAPTPFRRQGNPRGPSAAGVRGLELDPLIAASDDSKPLISKLLAVPEWRARYVGYVREIAEKWLDWDKLGPIASKAHDLIAPEVARDTRKLDSTDAFQASLTQDAGEGFGARSIGLKNFADQRRAYLLDYLAKLPK